MWLCVYAQSTRAVTCPTSVIGWGADFAGQATSPANLTNAVAIAAGGYHNLAVTSDRTVIGWGDNGYGQSTPPTEATGVVAVAGGYYHSLALKSDGTMVAWGINDNFQGQVPLGLTNVTRIAAGGAIDAVLYDGYPILANWPASVWNES